jgi:YidC/Oxa1 family membrane protein insertase
MDKNTIFALIAIFALVLAFQFIFLRPKLEQQRQDAQQKVEKQVKQPEAGKGEEKPGKEAVRKREALVTPQKPAEEQVISIDTDIYSVKLSTAGASIVSLQLKEYLDKNQAPVDLVSYDQKQNDILPFEVHYDRLRDLQSGERTPYYVEKLSETSYLFYRDFSDSDGKPFRVTKTFTFQKGEYMFDIQVKAKALADVGFNLNSDNVAYTLAWGPVLGPVSVIKNRYNVTTQGYHEAGRYRKVMGGAGGCSLRRAESRYEEISRILDWVGVSNRYFFIGVIPDQKDYLYSFDQRAQDKFFFGISHPRFKDGSFEDGFRVYAGPKDRRLLKKYGHGFESVMGGRLLKPITIFLEWMIKVFYGLTSNYGVAIILMTIVIKIILHPLTRKSFESMRRMSALQPKITEIKERFKNNPTEMNKATQALYKKEKINPMGGCLPMLLQLPIFYGLYNALSEMPELRNQTFLWIKDLSLPDTVTHLNTALPLIGYKFFEAGVEIARTDINILPFVMTATTLLQSKLTSGDQTAQQGKMMTYLFPIMFFFIFWNMPSGLVLYWTIQNILTIGQQYFIDFRFKKKAALAPAVPVKGVKRK